MSLQSGRLKDSVLAQGRVTTLMDDVGNHFREETLEQRKLIDSDVVLMRQDPLLICNISPRPICWIIFIPKHML